MARRSSFLLYTLSGLAVLFVALVGIFPFSSEAEARIIVCQTDPIIVFSDGTRLKIVAEIYTRKSNVRHIAYTVHAPEGIRLKKIIYTGHTMTSTTENVVWYHDAAPGEFRVDTIVYTRRGTVEVKTHGFLRRMKRHASGYSRQHLLMVFNANRAPVTSTSTPISISETPTSTPTEQATTVPEDTATPTSSPTATVDPPTVTDTVTPTPMPTETETATPSPTDSPTATVEPETPTPTVTDSP